MVAFSNLIHETKKLFGLKED